MAYELRDGSGNLFKNDKDGNESRPDYRGDIMLGGVAYTLAAWIKEGKNGKFMSISGQPKEQQQAKAQPKQQRQESQFDDFDIPF